MQGIELALGALIFALACGASVLISSGYLQLFALVVVFIASVSFVAWSLCRRFLYWPCYLAQVGGCIAVTKSLVLIIMPQPYYFLLAAGVLSLSVLQFILIIRRGLRDLVAG